MSRRRPWGAALAAVGVVALGLLAGGCGAGGGEDEARAAPAAERPQARILVVSATAGFRHESIPAAQTALRALGRASDDYEVTVDNRLERWNPRFLARYRAVVFALTSGELALTDPQRRALIAFVRRGGGFVGVHSATDTLYEFAPYGGLIGAYFQDHPYTAGVLRRVGPPHPSAAGQPRARVLSGDELYRFRSDPRATGKRILLRLDPTTVPGASPGEFLPVAWCGRQGRGRVYYNSLGHNVATWRAPWFRRQLDGALAWSVGRRSPGACPAV